ncbi:Neural cell adhesion molecule 1 [Orchesella cincta]|uniref:Neural cell adhesion molecule 1 n=1 Tax=Orchesella cincta TaxID=48709 RepID=A0A1D2MXD0_ORCCI|nr:Neural cell adhesion molecule 1 [Orchesella cincta]
MAQPQVLKNVTVKPFTILALVMWEVDEKDGNGGYPIKNFYISYRLKNSTIGDWQQCPLIHISPELRQYQIYHLHPNSTYLIQVWATNKLGKGPSTIVECSTHSNPQEIELGKRFLDGVDTFDVRIWIIAVAIVISTLCILGIATCCLFYKEYVVNLANQSSTSRDEHIELMPNIILNPGYDFQSMDLQEPDENSNDTNAPVRLNNNSVIYPARV